MGAYLDNKKVWTIPVEMESQVKTTRKNQSVQQKLNKKKKQLKTKSIRTDRMQILKELPFFDGLCFNQKFDSHCYCGYNRELYIYECEFCCREYNDYYCSDDYYDRRDYDDRCDYDDRYDYEDDYNSAQYQYESAMYDAWEELVDSMRHDDGPHAPSWMCHMRY